MILAPIALIVGVIAGWHLHRFYLAYLYKQMRWIRKQMRGGARR